MRLMRLAVAFVIVTLTLITTPALAQVTMQDYVPSYSSADCPFYVPDGEQVECGYLTVPENRAKPTGATVELAVATLISATANAETVIYLEGGPGGSALAGIDAWYASALRDHYDIVLIDQRGTGYSTPTLNCPESDDSDGSMDGNLAAAEACHERLLVEGIDLSGYTTVENAHDISDLGIALGLEKVILFGVSYGTRLALEIMQNHPEGVSRVIIDGIYPPNVQAYIEYAPNGQRALNELFKACAADATCNTAYPDLENVLYTTVDRLNAAPIPIDFGDGSGETDYDGDALVNDLFGFLYDTSMIPSLPALIYAANREDTDLFVRLYNGEFADESSSGRSSTLDNLSQEEFDSILRDYIEAYDGEPFTSQAVYEIYLADLSDTDYNDWIDNLYYDYDLMQYLGYDNFVDYFDYINVLSDDEYNDLLDEYEGGGSEAVEEEVIDDDAEGLFNNIDCNDEVPFETYAEAQAAAAQLPPQVGVPLLTTSEEQFETCKIWEVPTAPPSENEAIISDIPTLVLSGLLDPITPPAWGQLTSQTLNNSHFFTFPGMGHGSVDIDPCPTQIALAFLANPAAAPDASCIDNMQVLFVTDTQ